MSTLRRGASAVPISSETKHSDIGYRVGVGDYSTGEEVQVFVAEVRDKDLTVAIMEVNN